VTRGSTFVSPSNESRSVVLPHPTGPITAVIPLCLKLQVPDRMNGALPILCCLALLPFLSPLLVESPICIFTSSGRSQVAWTIKRHTSHDAHHTIQTTCHTPHVTRATYCTLPVSHLSPYLHHHTVGPIHSAVSRWTSEHTMSCRCFCI
jgi:hypothetical protein